MIQPPRHLDPSLMKQQNSPQPPSMHQPGMKYMENFMSPNASDLQKEQSSLSSFSNFPLGGCPPHLHIGQNDSMLHQAAKPNTMFASDMSGCQPAGISQSHSLLSNGHMVPGSSMNPRVGKNFCPDSSSLPARGEYSLFCCAFQISPCFLRLGERKTMSQTFRVQTFLI